MSWSSFIHLWSRGRVSATYLKHHQLALGVKFSRTVIIRYCNQYQKWLDFNLSQPYKNLYTYAGNISHQVYFLQGEHKGSCGFASIFSLLASSVCSRYGTWCCCTYWGSRTSLGQYTVGRSERLLWKANHRLFAQGIMQQQCYNYCVSIHLYNVLFIMCR